MKIKNEFEKFTDLTNSLLSVPHSVIKGKLDSERLAKKRKKSKQSSASREGA